MFDLNMLKNQDNTVKIFESGATRSGGNKPEYAGYLHPSVIKAYGAYMLRHQIQPDGTRRDCRNYQKGIPYESYAQSMMRHFIEVWSEYESYRLHGLWREEEVMESIMAMFFNVHGMAMEIIKETEYSEESNGR